MKIKIITDSFHFSMPVPIRMAGMVIRAIPESEFIKVREKAPYPYSQLITKETVLMIYEECKDIIREYKGLEAIHVEAHDGTFVSVKL